jgi:hypothetical protein
VRRGVLPTPGLLLLWRLTLLRRLLPLCRRGTWTWVHYLPHALGATHRASLADPSSELEHDGHPLAVKLFQAGVVSRCRRPSALCIVD